MTYYNTHTSQAECDADALMKVITEEKFPEYRSTIGPAAICALTSMHRAVEERVYWGIRRANIKWDMESFEALINMQTWGEE